jgi:hypothetical protein
LKTFFLPFFSTVKRPFKDDDDGDSA